MKLCKATVCTGNQRVCSLFLVLNFPPANLFLELIFFPKIDFQTCPKSFFDIFLWFQVISCKPTSPAPSGPNHTLPVPDGLRGKNGMQGTQLDENCRKIHLKPSEIHYLTYSNWIDAPIIGDLGDPGKSEDGFHVARQIRPSYSIQRFLTDGSVTDLGYFSLSLHRCFYLPSYQWNDNPFILILTPLIINTAGSF